jgi:hypothetical protein
VDTAADSTEETKMTTTMSGLRVYVNSPSAGQAGSIGVEDDASLPRVFYSRRANGPIYRWLYEERLAHWHVLRMHTSDFDSHKLCNASWKSLPETLQVQLSAHYLD